MIIILKTREYMELLQQLSDARARASAAEAENKVLREFNGRLDEEAKRGLNMLTRGLAGYDFWSDPEKEKERVAEAVKEAEAAEPIIPVSGRDWARVGQQLQDEIERKATLERRQNQIAEITNPRGENK